MQSIIFLQAGILVRKGIAPATLEDGTIDDSDPKNQEQASSAEEIKRWQGDNNACKMLVIDIDNDEAPNLFVSFVTHEGLEYTERTTGKHRQERYDTTHIKGVWMWGLALVLTLWKMPIIL